MSSKVSEIAVEFFQHLFNVVPHYVLGVLPAIAILGSSPEDGLFAKFVYLFCSLGSPFGGLFYYLNVRNDKLKMSLYWLEPRNFALDGRKELKYKPFGFHAKKVTPNQQQKMIIEECAAEASILDRFSTIASIYYIIVGVFLAISRAFGPCEWEDWPYIPLALAWTLPAAFKRVFGGIIVVHDPKKIFTRDNKGKNDTISERNVQDEAIVVVNYNRTQKNHKVTRIFLTAFISIITPWFSVFMAYFTPPVGYFCRSIYLTALCSIWTLNSIIALLLHIKGENNHKLCLCVQVVSCLSGIIVVVFFIFLVILSLDRKLWIKIFGSECLDDRTSIEINGCPSEGGIFSINDIY